MQQQNVRWRANGATPLSFDASFTYLLTYLFLSREPLRVSYTPNFVDLPRRISMASKSSTDTDQSRRRRIFFRAAAVAFNVQFFYAITEFLMFVY